MRRPPGSERLNHAGWWASHTVHGSELEAPGNREAFRKALTFDAVARWVADPGSRYWALGMGELLEKPSRVGGFLADYVMVEMYFVAVLRPEMLPVDSQGVLDLEAYQAVAYGPGSAVKLDPNVVPSWAVWSDPFDPEEMGPGYPEQVRELLVRDVLRMWAADPRSYWWVPGGYDISIADDPRMSGALAQARTGSGDVTRLRSIRVGIRPIRLELDEPNQPG